MYFLNGSKPTLLGTVGERQEPFNSVMAVNHRAGVMVVRASLFPESEQCFFASSGGRNNDFHCTPIPSGRVRGETAQINDAGQTTLNYTYAATKPDGSYDSQNTAYRIVVAASGGSGTTLVNQQGSQGGIDKVMSGKGQRLFYTIPGRKSKKLMSYDNGTATPIPDITSVSQLVGFEDGALILLQKSRLTVHRVK